MKFCCLVVIIMIMMCIFLIQSPRRCQQTPRLCKTVMRKLYLHILTLSYKVILFNLRFLYHRTEIVAVMWQEEKDPNTCFLWRYDLFWGDFFLVGGVLKIILAVESIINSLLPYFIFSSRNRSGKTEQVEI